MHCTAFRKSPRTASRRREWTWTCCTLDPGRKSQLAAEIARAIRARRPTQQGAAELLGVDQSKVLRITRGQFRSVSEAKLPVLVTKLGQDVKIVVGPVRRRAGNIELQFA